MTEDNIVFSIFNDAQNVRQPSKNHISRLCKEINRNKESAEINAHIINCYDKVLICSKKEQCIERLVTFFAHFVCETSSCEIFFLYLIGRSGSKDKTIRFRVCETLAKILKIMIDQNLNISDQIWSSLSDNIVLRLRDKCPTVRKWAVEVIQPLQDPSNESDIIIQELVRLFKSDPSTDVRVAALKCCAVCKFTLDLIIDRVRDVSLPVRLASMTILYQSIDCRQLNAAQKYSILQSGLHDRNSDMTNLVNKLVLKWLVSLDLSVPRLLKGVLGADSSQVSLYTSLEQSGNKTVAEVIAFKIIDNCERGVYSGQEGDTILNQCIPPWAEHASGAREISTKDLAWVFARCDYYKHDASTSGSKVCTVVDDLLPDTVVLCDLIVRNHDKLKLAPQDAEIELALTYFLRLTKYIDLSDVIGCNKLKEICLNMLQDVNLCDSLVDLVLSVYQLGCSALTLNPVKSIIDDIEELWNASNRAEESEGDAGDDTPILEQVRVMQLLAWSVQYLSHYKFSDCAEVVEKLNEFQKYVLESLQQPYVELRSMAVKCLGLYGIYSEANCVQFRDIIFEIASANMEDPVIRSQAIESLSDMALVYADNSVLSGVKIGSILCRMLDSDECLLVRIAAEAAAKLMFAGRVEDPRIFSQLLRIYHSDGSMLRSDDSDDDSGVSGLGGDSAGVDSSRMMQMLCIFFPSFFKASFGRENIVLECIPSLVADIANDLKCSADGEGNSHQPSIVKIASQLIEWCTFLEYQDDSSSNESSQPTKKSYITGIQCDVHIRFCAAVTKEILLLGLSKCEKKVLKELLKLFTLQTPCTWLTQPLVGETVLLMADSIKTRCQLDKASQTTLLKFITSCEEALTSLKGSQAGGGEGEDCAGGARSAREFVFSCVPGLADLIEMGNCEDCDEEQEQREVPCISTSAAFVPRPRSSIQKSSLKSASTKPPPEGSSRPSRTSKSKAQGRISLQAQELEESLAEEYGGESDDGDAADVENRVNQSASASAARSKRLGSRS